MIQLPPGALAAMEQSHAAYQMAIDTLIALIKTGNPECSDAVLVAQIGQAIDHKLNIEREKLAEFAATAVVRLARAEWVTS